MKRLLGGSRDLEVDPGVPGGVLGGPRGVPGESRGVPGGVPGGGVLGGSWWVEGPKTRHRCGFCKGVGTISRNQTSSARWLMPHFGGEYFGPQVVPGRGIKGEVNLPLGRGKDGSYSFSNTPWADGPANWKS